MALKWSPSEVNIATSATTGATHASTGFIFTFPAIFLLASQPAYALADGPLVNLDDGSMSTLAFIGIVASMFAGFLGVMYFIIFRRVWLVEDLLPLPGFEATLKMLDISSDVSTGAVEHARDSLKTIGVWTALTMVGLFLIEYPLIWVNDRKVVLLDFLAESAHVGDIGLASLYSRGKIHQPSGTVNGESLGQTTGRKRLAWNPFAYTPYVGGVDTVDVRHRLVHESPCGLPREPGHHRRLVLPCPAGGLHERPHLRRCATGQHPHQEYASGGSACAPTTPLRKPFEPSPSVPLSAVVCLVCSRWRTFADIFTDIGSAFKGDASQEYMEGKGWYEWPLKHIPIFMGVTFIAMIVISPSAGSLLCRPLSSLPFSS